MLKGRNLSMSAFVRTLCTHWQYKSPPLPFPFFVNPLPPTHTFFPFSPYFSKLLIHFFISILLFAFFNLILPFLYCYLRFLVSKFLRPYLNFSYFDTYQ